MNTLISLFFYKPSSVYLLCATRHRNSNKHIKFHCFSTKSLVLISRVLLVIEIPMNTFNSVVFLQTLWCLSAVCYLSQKLFFYTISSVDLLCATRHRNSKEHIKIRSFSTNPLVFIVYRLYSRVLSSSRPYQALTIKDDNQNDLNDKTFTFIQISPLVQFGQKLVQAGPPIPASQVIENRLLV